MHVFDLRHCRSEMAADVAGVALIPYYNQIMNIIETNKDLKKTFTGL